MKIAVIAAIAALSNVAVASDTYKIQVTRTAQDFYKIEGMGQAVFIKTAFCYEFAMYGEAILILNSQPFSGSMAIGKLIFTSDGATCRVDTLIR